MSNDIVARYLKQIEYLESEVIAMRRIADKLREQLTAQQQELKTRGKVPWWIQMKP